MDPAGVTSFQQVCDLRSLQRQHPADVPAGESEYTRLPRVEHGQQQMRLFDLLDDLVVEFGYVGDTQRGGDDRCGRGGYAVGCEDVVVRRCGAGEPLDELGTNLIASSAPVISVPRKWKMSSRWVAAKCTNS